MYRNLNDYEILYMIKEDSDTFNILYQKYQPLIYKTVKGYVSQFKKYGYEIDDLMQIGYVTLYKAINLYCDYNGSLFYTYFVKALHNALLNEKRMNETTKKEVLNNALSYDNCIGNGESTYLDVLFINSKKKDIKEENFILFKNSMSFDMGNIFELYMNGFNFNEISSLLDMEIIKVYYYFQKIRNHSLTYKSLFFE